MQSVNEFKYLFKCPLCITFAFAFAQMSNIFYLVFMFIYLTHLPLTQWCSKCSFQTNSIHIFWDTFETQNLGAHLPRIRSS